jgi:hypothetical protein
MGFANVGQDWMKEGWDPALGLPKNVDLQNLRLHS